MAVGAPRAAEPLTSVVWTSLPKYHAAMSVTPERFAPVRAFVTRVAMSEDRRPIVMLTHVVWYGFVST